MRGYFGIGIVKCKTSENYGTLFRTANIFNASFLFMVASRFKKQCSDTMRSERHIPLTEYNTLKDLKDKLPYGCKLVGIELDDKAIEIQNYNHPIRACYVLGAEDYGLSKEEMSLCHEIIKIPGDHSLNVAVAGSIVIYDRILKARKTCTILKKEQPSYLQLIDKDSEKIRGLFADIENKMNLIS